MASEHASGVVFASVCFWTAVLYARWSPNPRIAFGSYAVTVLGASHTVMRASLTEFLCIGYCLGRCDYAASALAYYVSAYVLSIPYQFNLGLALLTLLGASLLVPFAAWLGLRGFLRLPPRQLLQSI